MRATAYWPERRLFQYERRLAEAELEALGGRVLARLPEGLHFEHEEPRTLLSRVTHFTHIGVGDGRWSCVQNEVESQHLRERGSRERQATRFGVHGFHEYKGKFNPQLVRALINVVDPQAEVLSDPYAGSGTSLVEALRLGIHAHGRDRSPMAIFISQAKLKALTDPHPESTATELGSLSDRIGSALKRGQDSGSDAVVPHWRPTTHRYLERWFTPPAFAALREALSQHPQLESSTAAHLSLLALSSILREVSLQEPVDLRVRRRPGGYVAPSLRDAYSAVVDRLSAALAELAPWDQDLVATVRTGSADDPDLFESSAGRRLIVTSPPYATALPYIDTDRLSIMALGLATPEEARKLEASLTGSREWSRSAANEWRQAMEGDTHQLPTEITSLLTEIDATNQRFGAGFRRAAVPALLYRYFVAMRSDFIAWSRQLRPSEKAVVVVGRNRTGPPERRVTIETPELLSACARQVGFPQTEAIRLETWPRYGLHASNSVESEDALVFHR